MPTAADDVGFCSIEFLCRRTGKWEDFSLVQRELHSIFLLRVRVLAAQELERFQLT